MPDELVIRHCSPTLAGLKTANMFVCPCESNEDLRSELTCWNRILCKKGLRVLPLRYNDKKALIYLYRPSKLKRDLESAEACNMLKKCGYNCDSPERYIARLRTRLSECKDFPHEIGLFLGYPPEDVKGFIEHRPCKMTGFWKVYGDENEAKRKFDQFRKCSKVYYNCWCDGCSLERLAVASN